MFACGSLLLFGGGEGIFGMVWSVCHFLKEENNQRIVTKHFFSIMGFVGYHTEIGAYTTESLTHCHTVLPSFLFMKTFSVLEENYMEAISSLLFHLINCS